MLFQNWQEFCEFWSKHPKVSKMCTFVGSFPAKYITFHLKSAEELSFMTLKSHAKFQEKHEEFGKFSPHHSKVSKLGLLRGTFIQSRNCMSIKFTGELCVMIMKNDEKFEKELTCQIKNWHEEFNRLWHESLKVSKICILMGYFWPKYIMFELRKYKGVMFDDTQN